MRKKLITGNPKEAFILSTHLRNMGFDVVTWLERGTRLGKVLRYADRLKIPYVLWITKD